MGIRRFGRTAAVVASGLAACVALTGCNVGDKESDGGGADKGSVVMSYAGLDITIWNDVIKAMRPMVEDAGYRLVTHDPQWDIQKQVADWNAWAQQGDIKALMGFPVQNDALVPATKALIDAGIPVVGYASKWEGVDYAILFDCKAEGDTMGKDVAQWMVDHQAADELVALVADQSTDLGKCRVDGMRQGLKAVIPDVKVQILPGTSREDGNSGTKSLLVAHPDTRIFMGSSDDNAQGAYQALLDSGVPADSPDHLLVALDASKSTLETIASGKSFWRWGYVLPAQMLAKAQSGLLIAAANGDELQDETLVSLKADQESASQYIGK